MTRPRPPLPAPLRLVLVLALLVAVAGCGGEPEGDDSEFVPLGWDARCINDARWC